MPLKVHILMKVFLSNKLLDYYKVWLNVFREIAVQRNQKANKRSLHQILPVVLILVKDHPVV